MTKPTPSVPYFVIPLQTLLLPEWEDLAAQVFTSLATFECARSKHLQDFARRDHLKYEAHGHSRTYFLVTNSSQQPLEVIAFFTVGMATLNFGKVQSKTLKSKLLGNITTTEAGAYSIAELARSDKYTSQQMPGATILQEAKNVIRQARQHVGGRYLVVTAQPAVFRSLYEPAGFAAIHSAEPPRAMPGMHFVAGCCQIRDL